MLKKNKQISLSIVILLGFALSQVPVFHFSLKSPLHDSSASLTKNVTALYAQEKASLPAQTGSGLPIRLKIPKINVDAAVDHVGLTSDGQMDVPSAPSNVAWFQLGPRPGEKGSSVIDGHSGWKNGISAVFDNLYKLHKGDKLYVQDEKGMTTIFVVREIRIYDPEADASDVFGSSDGKAHLNLITCSGVWNKTEKSSSDRLVVFTDME